VSTIEHNRQTTLWLTNRKYETRLSSTWSTVTCPVVIASRIIGPDCWRRRHLTAATGTILFRSALVVYTSITTPYVWPSVSSWVVQSARLTPAPAASWWILSANMHCPARNSQPEFSAMLGSTAPWSGQKHQPSRSLRVSAETTERDPMAWRWYHGSRDAVTRGMTVAHTLATSYVSQNVLQTGSAAAAESARKTTKYSTLSASHMFFRDSWSLVRRGSQPHCRNRQKSNALHSRSAGNYVPVPAYFSDNSAFQTMLCALPTRSKFPSPNRNRSGHTFLLLLILRRWEWSTRAK